MRYILPNPDVAVNLYIVALPISFIDTLDDPSALRLPAAMMQDNLPVILTQIGISLLFLTVKAIDQNLLRARQITNQSSEQEKKQREMLEKVIQAGKVVTEQTASLNDTVLKIRNILQATFDFDRVGIFLYEAEDNIMQGTYGTDRSGHLSNEWDMRFEPAEGGLMKKVLSRPDGHYFTHDYDNEVIHSSPDHAMRGVKYYAAVACWSGDKPMAILCVDQLISGRAISQEQLEALRLFAGYVGLAIENTRLHTEVTARMQEREVIIAELEQRNAELERFNYTVSHELKNPIVTMKGFIGSIKNDLQRGNLGRAEKDLARIATAADIMHETVSGLLELSRIGRVSHPPTEIPTKQLLQEALDNVEARIRANRVEVTVMPDLPNLYGDRIRLREVFENLIDNAAKYVGDQRSVEIKIGIKPQDSLEPVFFVEDNGLGIAPQYHTRVFNLFEKLNPTSEGSGIGLALVKRIIETHGGKIWVESEGLGKGSTFYFTIPDNRQNQPEAVSL